MKLKTRLILWWQKLFIRKDEFDKSLDMNVKAMLDMNSYEQEKYLYDLVRRRNIAHERDLKDSDLKKDK